MSLPKLIDFNQAVNNAERFNRNRSCYLHINNQQELLSDIPHQFSVMVRSTKAAIKRGDLKRAFAEFTRDQWYAIMLSQPTTNQWGHSATEYVFTMNPSYKKTIEANLDEYRYQYLLEKLESWNNPSIRKIDPKELLTDYVGWDVRNLVNGHLKHYLYHRVLECGNFPSVVCLLFRYLVGGELNQTLPTAFTKTIHASLQELQSHINRTFGKNLNIPYHENLDNIIRKNTSM